MNVIISCDFKEKIPTILLLCDLHLFSCCCCFLVFFRGGGVFVSTWKSKRVYICAIEIILFSAILHTICFVPMVLRDHAFYAAVINSQLSIRTFMNSKY